MKAKWGAIVVDGRGKLGGHVASKNRAGGYFRTKVTPVNAQSPYQTATRAQFALLSSAWRGLTDAQRAAWSAIVADYPQTNQFGDVFHLTGATLYQRLNNNLLLVEGEIIDLPAAPEAIVFSGIDSLAADTGTQVITLVLNDAVDADTALKIYATPSLSAGKTYVKNEYKFISTAAPEAIAEIILTVPYLARYGAVGAENSKIHVQIIPVNIITGAAGPAVSISCTITDA